MPEALPPGSYLGFDFGLKYIGVAVGQTISGTANPLCVINIKSGIDWSKISALVNEWSPKGLIVGLPLTADGKKTPLLKAIEKFTRELDMRYQLPIHHIDERLSSFAARDLLNESTPGKMGRLDNAAAAIILQTWFHQYDDKH